MIHKRHKKRKGNKDEKIVFSSCCNDEYDIHICREFRE